MLKITIEGTPISINHLYGSRGSRRFMTSRGKQFKQMVSDLASSLVEGNKIYPTPHPVEVELAYYFSDRRKRDIQNLNKEVLDAFNGIIYDDDSQVVRLVLSKHISKHKPKTEIKIRIKKTSQ
jgi:Holliday junction resolvase RusA-like endonuclease